MGCNCNEKISKKIAPHADKFGTCAICMYATLAGFICSWLLVVPLLYIGLPWSVTIVLSLPAAFFTIWLAAHLIKGGYFIHIARGIRGAVAGRHGA